MFTTSLNNDRSINFLGTYILRCVALVSKVMKNSLHVGVKYLASNGDYDENRKNVQFDEKKLQIFNQRVVHIIMPPLFGTKR